MIVNGLPEKGARLFILFFLFSVSMSSSCRYFGVLLLFLLPCRFAAAQQEDSVIAVMGLSGSSAAWYREHGYRINKTYILSYFTDLPKVAVSPLRYSARDWRAVAFVTAGAGAFLLTDKSVNKLMRANQEQFYTEVAKVVEPFGNKYPPFIIGAMYLTGVVTKNRKIEHASLMTAKSLVFSTLFYVSTKQVIRRRRPLYTEDPYEFNEPFQGGREYTSFPSGHSNTIFTVATALAIEFKDTKWVPPVAYTLATLTALSRLYDNRHWSSDVWIGAAFGHFITRAIYKVEARKKEKQMLKLNF